MINPQPFGTQPAGFKGPAALPGAPGTAGGPMVQPPSGYMPDAGQGPLVQPPPSMPGTAGGPMIQPPPGYMPGGAAPGMSPSGWGRPMPQQRPMNNMSGLIAALRGRR